MRGDDVSQLQGYLTLAGFPTAVDGQFGPVTKANVIAFQEAHSLPANGIVTAAVVQALRLAIAAFENSAPAGKARINPLDGECSWWRAGARHGDDRGRQQDHRQAVCRRRRTCQMERRRLRLLGRGELRAARRRLASAPEDSTELESSEALDPAAGSRSMPIRATPGWSLRGSH